MLEVKKTCHIVTALAEFLFLIPKFGWSCSKNPKYNSDYVIVSFAYERNLSIAIFSSSPKEKALPKSASTLSKVSTRWRGCEFLGS